MFDRSSMDVRQMFNGCSTDVQQIFYRCSFGRSIVCPAGYIDLKWGIWPVICCLNPGTQTKIKHVFENIENAFNARNLKFINQSFGNDESLKITKQFSDIVKEFPDSKWKIKKLKLID